MSGKAYCLSDTQKSALVRVRVSVRVRLRLRVRLRVRLRGRVGLRVRVRVRVRVRHPEVRLREGARERPRQHLVLWRDGGKDDVLHLIRVRG